MTDDLRRRFLLTPTEPYVFRLENLLQSKLERHARTKHEQ